MIHSYFFSFDCPILWKTNWVKLPWKDNSCVFAILVHILLLTCLLVTELTNPAPSCHNKYQDSRIGNVIVTIHRNYRIHSSLASLPFSAKMKWYEDNLSSFLVHFYWRFVYIKMCNHWKETKKGLNVYPP